jgi:hypothetical protein
MTTMTYAGELVVLDCWCGITHAVPNSLREHQLRQFNAGEKPLGIYCPLGHSHVPAGESESAKLKRQLAFERDMRASITAERDQAAASLRTTKGVVTKLRKRAVAGVCPFGCRRHFADLSAHVISKHPGEKFEGE